MASLSGYRRERSGHGLGRIPRSEQRPRDDPTEHEPADMRKERYAASLRRRGEECVVRFVELIENQPPR